MTGTLRRLTMTATVAAAVAGAVLVTGAWGHDRQSLDDAVAGMPRTSSPMATGVMSTEVIGTDATAPAGSAVATAPSTGSGVGDFEGSLDGTVPYTHSIDLTAGAALRVWIKPTDDVLETTVFDETDGRAYENPFFYGLSLAIEIDPALREHYDSSSLLEEASWFFSDYPGLGSGDDGPGVLAGYTTIGGVLSTRNASSDPPLFFCGARGGSWGAINQGTWVSFVAPADGTYSVLASGLGGYELHVDAVDFPGDVPAGDPFPFVGPAWQAAVEAQWKALFDPAYFVADNFYSDFDTESPTDYGPADAMTACAERLMGETGLPAGSS